MFGGFTLELEIRETFFRLEVLQLHDFRIFNSFFSQSTIRGSIYQVGKQEAGIATLMLVGDATGNRDGRICITISLAVTA
jgi:hypothetical protein